MSEWDWELTDTARRDFDSLDNHARDRIASKLDEIVTDDWREPSEHLEPLSNITTTIRISPVVHARSSPDVRARLGRCVLGHRCQPAV